MRALSMSMMLVTGCLVGCGRDQPRTVASSAPEQVPSSRAETTAGTGEAHRSTAPNAGDPTPREPIGWVVLEDIQGLFGGHALYVWPDGRFVARVVRTPAEGEPPGLREQRYEGRLTDEQLQGLSALLAEQDFARLVVPERPGVPDEARADLRVQWRSGRTARAVKWERQREDRFGAVQGWLMDRVREAEAGRPVHEGTYDYRYRPEGPWTAGWAAP